jgi:enoyl-[acyl-carrier protein] reductase I
MLLAGKRLVITGVLTRESIAYSVAEAAQHQGAEIVLTSFGRARRITERAARRLPEPADVLELDVTSDEDLVALQGELRSRWGGVDGALHAVAFAPADAMVGGVVNATEPSLHTTFEVSVFSFQRLAQALGPLMSDRPSGASLIGMDFHAQPLWPGYDWMGIAKTALRDLTRYLACELGGHGIRCNLISSGPLSTVASGAIPNWRVIEEAFPHHAPLGWDLRDPTPVADAAAFLFSDLSRGITGESIHVDGGVHALGGFSPVPVKRGRAKFTTQPDGTRAESPDAYAVAEEIPT